MNTEIIGIVAQVVLMVVSAIRWKIHRSCISRKKGLYIFMKPIEGWIFRLSGIHPDEEINWNNS